MARKDFDDLLLVIRSNLTDDASSAVISREVDFNLPRGFIAKIKKIRFEFNDLIVELEDTIGPVTISMAIIRDPDDITSTGMPSNTDAHDVIAEFNSSHISDTVSSEIVAGEQSYDIDFSEDDEDVITARNMRFNMSGLATALFTPTANCKVWYTLESVTDDIILNLLDIL